MGLTSSSTGSKVISEFIYNISNNCDYIVAIAGNPNVGKSTIFNYFTGMHQHTGNWPGKTVSNASGIRNYNDKQFLFVDIQILASKLLDFSKFINKGLKSFEDRDKTLFMKIAINHFSCDSTFCNRGFQLMHDRAQE